jgi:indole-3-glycerol phosphate synthase
MLEAFKKAQQSAIQRLLALEAAGELPPPFGGPRPSLIARLRQGGPGAVIAEYKRASPSAGDINLALGPEQVAAAYAEAGASALSVLTEERHFKGDLNYLTRMAGPGLPLLRKDFLLHPLQVMETAATPAAALLIIVRMHDDAGLSAMLTKTRDCGLEAVMEIFDRDDLARARAAIEATGTGRLALIQVNNRDLQTMLVREESSRELIREKRQGETWISASGANSAHDLRERARLGYDAVLVGSALMREADPGAALSRLLGGKGDQA